MAVLVVMLLTALPARAQEAPSLPAAMLWPETAMEQPVRVVSAPAADPLPDPWLARDKALHAAGSFLLTLSAQYVLTAKADVDHDAAWPAAAGLTLSLGLAKEVADSQRAQNPFFSWRDLVADAAGIGLALVVIWL